MSIPPLAEPDDLAAAAVRAARTGVWTAVVRPGAVTIDQALTGQTAATVRVAADDPASGDLVTALDLLALTARHRGQALPTLLLPIEHADALTLAGRAAARDTARVCENFGRHQLRLVLQEIMDTCAQGQISGFDPARHPPLAAAVARAQSLGVPDAAIASAIDLAAEGEEIFPLIEAAGESGSLSLPPITLLIPDAFFEAALTGHGFVQNDGCHVDATRQLDQIVQSIWLGGQPQVVLRDRITVSPVADAPSCSGLVNLQPFMQGRTIDTAGIAHVVRVVVTQLTATNAPLIRLGLTNIASGLMAQGLGYDTAAGRTIAATLAALITAEAMIVLAERAAVSGVAGVGAGRQGLCGVAQNMRDRFAGSAFGASDRLGVPTGFDPALLRDDDLKRMVIARLDQAVDMVRRHGVLMMVETTVGDAEPDLHNHLQARTPDLQPETQLIDQPLPADGDVDAGGVYRRHLTPAVPAALQRLGYTASQIDDIHFYVLGHGSLLGAPALHHDSLRARGLDDRAIARVEAALQGASSLDHALNIFVLGRAYCRDQLQVSDDDDLARSLGFSDDEIAAASLYACGSGTLEGAPHLRPEHLPVFDTASGPGVRRISPAARVLMQAALEPFLTGAVHQTITLDPAASRDDIRQLILSAWQLGVKHLALYRAGGGLDAPVVPIIAALTNIDVIDKKEKIIKKTPLTTS